MLTSIHKTRTSRQDHFQSERHKLLWLERTLQMVKQHNVHSWLLCLAVRYFFFHVLKTVRLKETLAWKSLKKIIISVILLWPLESSPYRNYDGTLSWNSAHRYKSMFTKTLFMTYARSGCLEVNLPSTCYSSVRQVNRQRFARLVEGKYDM